MNDVQRVPQTVTRLSEHCREMNDVQREREKLRVLFASVTPKGFIQHDHARKLAL
jgi:hypothetical protein